MGTTYYYTANNEMIGEHTLGQSRIDYLTDSLGSIVTTVDQSLTVVSTARYKPYGADLATTGTTPSFGYVGSPGYRRTKLPYSDLYVRKRHLASVTGRWGAVDPLWPKLKQYSYVRARPTILVDPSGLNFHPIRFPYPGPPPAQPPKCGQPWVGYIYNYCNNCYYGTGYRPPGCSVNCSLWAGQYYSDCGKGLQFPNPIPPSGWRPICPGCDVTPDRPLTPTSGPVFAGPPPLDIGPVLPDGCQYHTPTKCINAGSNGMDYVFDLNACIACVKRSGPAFSFDGCYDAVKEWGGLHPGDGTEERSPGPEPVD